jgi:hypothetical protein
VHDKELFFLLKDRLYDEKVRVFEEFGGHSSLWALRAMEEGCRVYTAAQPNNFNKKSLKWQGESTGLIHPIDLMDVDEDVNKPVNQDTHLVFEYKEGDKILGYTAPRSNRFYYSYDPNGSKLAQSTDYHIILDQLEEKDRPYRHMIGGFQFLQKNDAAYTETLLREMRDSWFDTKDQKGPNG